MNEKLRLPEELGGAWENLLIMTYGVNVPFFENSIWNSLSAKCRNKIILADGQHYLDACQAYAENGLARYINQKYVVEGVYLPKASHAKVILLTNPEEGRLFIGSGNLNWQGYASGGEMFTTYEFDANKPETISPFLEVWGFIEQLQGIKAIGPAASPYLQRMYEKTGWLLRSSPDTFCTVRSNLKTSFLTQLQKVVNGEKVRELWVLAPFYDQQAFALKKMIDTFSPEMVHLVIQSRFASLDVDSVNMVLKSYRGKWEINPFSTLLNSTENTYVHTKLFIIKTPTRSICLQGSPNLSQVAMLFTVPQGNFEIANLLLGETDEFDDLLNSLALEPATHDFASLDVTFQQDDKLKRLQGFDWRLICADWQKDKLHFYFQGNPPDIKNPQIKIGENLFEFTIIERGESRWVIQLSVEMQLDLASTVPVAIQWDENGKSQSTSPIFPYNTDSLVRELQESVIDDKPLHKLGDFDLKDVELEKLLSELDSALLIDRKSIWQLAGRTPPIYSGDNDDALLLSYADIDYEKLKQHPKILQYSKNGGLGRQPGYALSRLQIILNSITNHFLGLRDMTKGHLVIQEGDLTNNQEEGEDKPPKVGKQKPKKNYIRKILRSFIKRYLHGLKSKDFVNLVGFEVIANNYVIFSHILWRLLDKDFVEKEFIFDSFFEIWEFIWGFNDKAGYLNYLGEIERTLCLKLFREKSTDSQWIAAIFYGDHMCRLEGWTDRKLILRDNFRKIIEQKLVDVNKEVVEESRIYTGSLMPYNRPLPGYIFQRLAELARYETSSDFLRGLESEFGFEANCCEIDNTSKYFQKHLNDSAVGETLIIKDKSKPLTKELTTQIMQYWMKHQSKKYYRIVNNPQTLACSYCSPLSEGVFFQLEPARNEKLTKITPAPPKSWEVDITHIQEIAKVIDAEISINSELIKEIK
jgi:hypothetical protein